MKQIVDVDQAEKLEMAGIDCGNLHSFEVKNGMASFNAPTIGELIEWIEKQGYMTYVIEVGHDDGSMDYEITTFVHKLKAHGYQLIDALVELCIKIKEAETKRRNDNDRHKTH